MQSKAGKKISQVIFLQKRGQFCSLCLAFVFKHNFHLRCLFVTCGLVFKSLWVCFLSLLILTRNLSFFLIPHFLTCGLVFWSWLTLFRNLILVFEIWCQACKLLLSFLRKQESNHVGICALFKIDSVSSTE